MNLGDHVRIRHEKFGALLFDQQREKFFVVNGVSKDILELMPEAETIDDIVEGLSQTYDSPPEIMKRDILEFVEELRKAGLMPRSSNGS